MYSARIVDKSYRNRFGWWRSRDMLRVSMLTIDAGLSEIIGVERGSGGASHDALPG